MTKSVANAQGDEDPPKQFISSSQVPSTPLVHDATFTRRPRTVFTPGSKAGDEAGFPTKARVSCAFISRQQPESPLKRRSMTGTESLPKAHGMSTNARPTDLPQSQVQPSASTIFSRTIQDLEGLLNEALHIARIAADDHGEDVRVVDMLSHEHEDHSRVLAAGVEPTSDGKMTIFSKKSILTPKEALAYHGPKQSHKQDSIKACGPAHQGGMEAKASLAEPQVSYVLQQDWAQPARTPLRPDEPPKRPGAPDVASLSLKEPTAHILRRKASRLDLPSREGISHLVKRQVHPKVLSRSTSKRCKQAEGGEENFGTGAQLDNVYKQDNEAGVSLGNPSPTSDVNTVDRFERIFAMESSHASSQRFPNQRPKHIDLNGCRHVDVKNEQDFNVHDTWRHQPIARDWAISRKRFAATIACINTSLIGIIIGIYAGEVPAFQYVIVDLGHSTILGNVVLYLGLAIPTLFFWPLPLMHGRKPYTVMALAVALCLQIPQGIAVSEFRSPYVSTYRRILLLSRAASGFALGFVNINSQATLLDLFGASLQSGNPHQEVVDLYDVRRHGGGLGLWLGLLSWCSVGSISVGFFIGALIVDTADVTWGFWTSLTLMMVVLLLNVIGPEVRRSAYRHTVADLMGDEGHVSRVSRGEVKMHLKSAGPYWWGEEVKAGMELCWKMLQQPGFAVLAVYIGWAYAHFTLILMVFPLAKKFCITC
jgi:MFS family permease